MADLVYKTIGQLLEEQAEKYPDKEAVVYSDRDLRLTYKEFNEWSDQVAKALIALGIEKGDHIAVWTSNVPEWVALQFATGKMGAPLVTVNTNYRAAELEYLLKQSDSQTLVLIEQYKDHRYIDTLYEICPELKNSRPGELKSKRLPMLKNVILIGDSQYDGVYNWNDVIQLADQVSDEELEKRKASLHYNDVINLQYTSGTTGFPKGVMLTHFNIVNNGINIAECMKLTPEDRLCIPVPFFHCFGCVIGTMAIVSAGGTMVPIQEYNPVEVLKTVEKEKCTALHGVPTMFISELNLPNFDEFDLSSLRTGVMAGSNCPEELMKKVIHKMNMKDITICYGQTESSPVITQTRTDDPFELKVSTVGRALPNVEVKIIDPKTGEEVPPNTQGELCTRGYHVMKGYYNNPDATKEAIDEDGWLHTGDLATMDENGYVRITGRLKDMIIRGGENIYPREIEEFLYKNPKIYDVQIVGVPDEKYGEEVAAFIILKQGETATEEEIREFCEGKISKHKIPKYIFFVDKYPMTASGKIQKYKLKEQFTSKLVHK
ncbi:AMP-binding protein [Ureibacillus terrenus]|uniref:AMP-binding protein n=1 Tax=Ureibacillus terrenus TaxID=118246 RepID=A0A540V185_9BACL|nr:AMP-binding protein [Ureibacillus terrenus]MED3662334.1 AMP-binding protein [Ureibacillus terrenus]MED3764528.1 AMP-binding protein [Ureibacillus terrenus]TQE90514.1 AMP-binding protein [Ureibacillus terrenus]